MTDKEKAEIESDILFLVEKGIEATINDVYETSLDGANNDEQITVTKEVLENLEKVIAEAIRTVGGEE